MLWVTLTETFRSGQVCSNSFLKELQRTRNLGLPERLFARASFNTTFASPTSRMSGEAASFFDASVFRRLAVICRSREAASTMLQFFPRVFTDGRPGPSQRMCAFIIDRWARHCKAA